MRIVKDGIPFIAVPVLAGVLVPTLGYNVFTTAAGMLLIAVGLLCLYFFRDPLRVPVQNDGLILAPADGVIMEILDEGGTKGIRIFLSVFNVHLQRSPCAGTVKSIEYIKGQYLPAMNKQAHLVNEQNIFTIETPKGDVIIKQIAGILARRVVSWVKPGQNIAQGQKIGFIKFGSQVDIIMPAAVELTVKTGSRVTGGITIIGKFNKQDERENTSGRYGI